MSSYDGQEYAERVANNASGMLKGATQNEDGTPKGMSDAVWAGVMNAQSNLAIAAALMWVAAEIKECRE